MPEGAGEVEPQPPRAHVPSSCPLPSVWLSHVPMAPGSLFTLVPGPLPGPSAGTLCRDPLPGPLPGPSAGTLCRDPLPLLSLCFLPGALGSCPLPGGSPAGCCSPGLPAPSASGQLPRAPPCYPLIRHTCPRCIAVPGAPGPRGLSWPHSEGH